MDFAADLDRAPRFAGAFPPREAALPTTLTRTRVCVGSTVSVSPSAPRIATIVEKRGLPFADSALCVRSSS